MTRRKSLLISLTILIVPLGAAVLAFRGAGRWLVREDRLEPADTIVVLSGGMPARAEEAAAIFRQGYAHEVWVSRPAAPTAALGAMAIRYAGEEEYNREILIHRGVPEGDIRILPDEIFDTEQEVHEVSSLLARQEKKSAILVTSMPHTRRVRLLWGTLTPKNQTSIVRGSPDDRFDANRWWRNTHDMFSVVREMLGLLNARLGLPVRPPNW
jgi:uncharacterized SAM-binding protein YcdF (DUF218 family)